ncbi:unnamed protein product [Peronospora belbahrii]|uniref:RING-type domain-containing protein n=1 Tax=Peronospora belbahrii TaxID=622444 RepID=A0AAU9LJW5_9STRA|nr:unnamed protein product [Peronospora belbahrii]CAH0520251.1 unnamed protein product [Peronospora belbahrii]
MVFISLEDVIETNNSIHADKCNTQHSVHPEATPRVVVTPGSPTKQQGMPLARAGFFSIQHTPSSLLLYVSDSVICQKWVLSKTSDDCSKLRKNIRRVGNDCRDPACCGPVQRLSFKISTRRVWGSPTNTSKQYDECNAFQTYLNDLVQAVLGRNTGCQTMKRTRHLLEDFLNIAYHRANAMDCVLYHKNQAASLTVKSMKPCQVGRGCDDSIECLICCGDLANDKTLRLPCGHKYHAGCMRVWFNVQQTCPVCRLHLDIRVMSE